VRGRDAVGMSSDQDQDRVQGPGAITQDFTISDLRRIRSLVQEASTAVGLAPDVTVDLVIAVNEILINAVLHAGGGGSVTVGSSADGVLVEVRDNGPGVPMDVPTERPGPQVEGGRGLWMARKLCRHLTITNGPTGATVRLFMPT
jgi:serine/threonine-protein kinase RsbW